MHKFCACRKLKLMNESNSLNKSHHPLENKIPKKSRRYLQAGQSFLEFVLLLSAISLLSVIITRNANNYIVKKWKTMVEAITDSSVDFR
jgi:hypothetical protein